ncbi:hypothetical protein OPV22_020469 [Ensete ventricosum]|uniref:Uncharacterized protein n=1 Tax=Ensete ventricosum TaxID=4639 RepID=A0AAV8QEV4_ENSVE|nr:hypothetical protein OPV22_020469 [Ensete ventricosum]
MERWKPIRGNPPLLRWCSIESASLMLLWSVNFKPSLEEMSESDNNESGLNLKFQNSSDSIFGMPIKKRLFHLSQCPSPRSQETDVSPHDCEISISSTEHIVHSDIMPIPGSFSRASSQEFGLNNARPSGQGTSTAGLTMGDKSFGLSIMDTTKNMSTPNIPPGLPVGEMDVEEKFSSVRPTDPANSELRLTLSSDAKNYGYNLFQQGRNETCSSDLPLAPQITFSETDAKTGSSNVVNRFNLDLNIPVDTWEATIGESVIEHSIHEMLNGIEACSDQTIRADVTLGKSIIGSSHYDHWLSNLGKTDERHKESGLGLDLQLKPPSRPVSYIKWGAVAPNLSLSLECNVSNASFEAIKTEPHIDNSQNDCLNAHLSGSNLALSMCVKPQTCSGNFQDGSPKVKCSGDHKQAARRVMKMELSEQPSNEYFSRPAVRAVNTEFHNNKPTHKHIEVPLSMSEPMDSNSVTASDENVLDVDGSVMFVKTDINTSPVAAPSVVNPSFEECCKFAETLDSTCSLEKAEVSATKAADLDVDSVISDVKEKFKGAATSVDACLASNSFYESVVPVALDGTSEGFVGSDDEYCKSLKSIAENNLHLDSMGKSTRGEEKQESVDLSSKIQELYDDKQVPYDSPHGSGVARDKALTHGAGVGEYKDGKHGDLVPQEPFEASCEEGEKAGNEIATDTTAAVDVSVNTLSNLEVNGKNIQILDVVADATGAVDVAGDMPPNLKVNNEQMKILDEQIGHGGEVFDGNLCNYKNESGYSLTTDLLKSSGMRVSMTSSSTRLAKLLQKANRKDRGPPMKLRPIGSLSSKFVRTCEDDVSSQQVNAKEEERGPPMTSRPIGSLSSKFVKTCEDDASIVSNQQVNAKEDIPMKNPVTLESDSDASGLADKHVDNSGKCSQISKVNSLGTNKLSSGKMSPITSRLVFSQTGRKGLIDKPHRHDRSHSRGGRSERYDNRSFRYGSNDQDQPVQKCGTDLMNTRRDGNNVSACDRDSGPRYAPNVNDSKGYRFTRPSNRHEVPLRTAADGSAGGDGRIIRRFMNNESPHLSRFSYSRHSLGAHDGPSIAIRISRGVYQEDSPNRFTGRHVPTILPDHEKMVRGLPNEVIDPFFNSDRYVQYEQAENYPLLRERSLSPTHRRGPPICLPRRHSPDQFPPPRLPGIVYEGHAELMRHRSPPLRSPPRRLCLPEHAMVSNGLLPYSHLASDIREMHPMREVDLPRPRRGSQRNIRRFNLCVQQENAEDYGSMHFAQQTLHAEDELLHRRKYDGKRAYLQSCGNHHPVGDGGEERITYPVDGDPPRPIRFCPDREGFSDRSSLRGRVMRSTSNTSRRMAEREDFRNRGLPARHDSDFNDVRLKRRRV